MILEAGACSHGSIQKNTHHDTVAGWVRLLDSLQNLQKPLEKMPWAAGWPP